MTADHDLGGGALIDRSKLSRTQYVYFILCALAFGLDGVDTQIIGYIAPSLLASFHVPRTVLGGLFSSGLAGLLAGSLIISPFADTYGRKSIIIFSVVMFGIFTLVSIWSRTIDELIFWRFVTGLGLGGAIPNILALVSDYSPAGRRATIIILVSSSNAAGATLGGMLASVLVPAFGWQVMFAICGIAPLVLAVFLCFYLDELLSWLIARQRSPEQIRRIAERLGELLHGIRLVQDRAAGLPYGAFLKHYMLQPANAVNFLAIMVIYFMVMFELFFVSSWATTMLSEAGLPMAAAIQSSSLFQTGGFVGMVLIAFFAADRDISKLFIGMLVLACAMVAATSFAIAAPVLVISSMMFATGFFMVPCLPGASSMVGRIYPVAIRATAFGTAYAAGRLGSVFGPLFGQEMHALGLSGQASFMLSALPCLIAAAAVLVVYRNTLGQRTGMAAAGE